MALGIDITRLTPLYPNGVFLQWELTSPSVAGAYTFSVARSGSSNGPWEVLAATLSNTYNYLDVAPPTPPTPDVSTLPAPQIAPPPPLAFNQLAMTRAMYYRVIVTPPAGGGAAVTTVAEVEPHLSGKQRLLRRKMLRDAAMGFRHLNGVDVAVLKRVRWGPRCDKCVDAFTKEVVRANCGSCYGTGFAPAFYAPVITLGRRGTRPLGKQLTPQGVMEYRPTQVTLLDVPKVEPDDVLVFLRDNKRFIVKTAIETELQTVGVHQKFEVSEIARSSPEYRIPVNMVTTRALYSKTTAQQVAKYTTVTTAPGEGPFAEK